MERHDPAPSESVNVFNAAIEQRDADWCVVSLIDGQRKVVSRHPTREAADLAFAVLNESGTRDRRAQT